MYIYIYMAELIFARWLYIYCVLRFTADVATYTCVPCVSNCGWVPASNSELSSMAQAYCKGLTATLSVAGGPGAQPIGLWNVAEVTSLGSVFKDNCASFNDDIGQWNTAKVTSMSVSCICISPCRMTGVFCVCK